MCSFCDLKSNQMCLLHFITRSTPLLKGLPFSSVGTRHIQHHEIRQRTQQPIGPGEVRHRFFSQNLGVVGLGDVDPHRARGGPPHGQLLVLEALQARRDGLRAVVVQTHGVDHHLIAGDAPTPVTKRCVVRGQRDVV